MGAPRASWRMPTALRRRGKGRYCCAAWRCIQGALVLCAGLQSLGDYAQGTEGEQVVPAEETAPAVLIKAVSDRKENTRKMASSAGARAMVDIVLRVVEEGICRCIMKELILG